MAKLNTPLTLCTEAEAGRCSHNPPPQTGF